MNNGTVHFSIGENFGQTLTNIATEKITEDYNVSKAISTLEEALVGISQEMVIKVLHGTHVLEVDVNTQEVLFTEYDKEKHSDYRIIDWNEWCRKLYHRTIESFKGFNMGLGWTANTLDKIDRQGYEVDLGIEEIIEFVFSDEPSDIMDSISERIVGELKYSSPVWDVRDTILMSKKISVKALQIAQCIKHLHQIGLFTDEVRAGMYSENLISRAADVNRKLNGFARGKFIEEAEQDELRAYIDNAIRLDNELESGIKPIEDIRTSELCDAYWISPDGIAYGLKGDVANMLHFRMAVAIVNDEDVDESIPEDQIEDSKEGTSADRKLGEDGWCKITNNWVLFDGYYYNKSLTKEQQKTISTIGQRINIEKKKPLKVGLTQIEMTGAMFGMIEPMMMQKHLSV
jgi:hypothetical protein